MGRDVNVKDKRASVRRRAAAAIHSDRRAKSAKKDLKDLSVLVTEKPGQLVAEGRLERTTTVKQANIRASVDRAASDRGSFALDLQDARLTPYTHARYSRSGRSLLVASERGHVAVAEWRSARLRTELFLNETVRDATFLHTDAFFAVAQRKYAYIYDGSGIELHVLRNHRDPGTLAFLPHHLLLASASCPTSQHPRLVYTDTTSGHEVASHDLSSRRLDVASVRSLCHNPANGVVHAAHANGVVTLWAPSTAEPLARLFTQRGGVRHVAVDPARNLMATLGHDGTTKEWDLRMFRPIVETHTMPLATGVAYSQRSLLAVCGASSVQIWRPSDLAERRGKAYMTERYHGKRPTNVHFCPFEDVLAVSHQTGVCSMLIPGAGEAQFDSQAPNPYLTRNQGREMEVRILLDKLPPESIALDTGFIGNVDTDPAARRKELRQMMHDAQVKKREKKLGVKKAKGKNKTSKRLKRKEHHNKETTRIEREEKKDKIKEIQELAEKIQKERDAEQNNSKLVITPKRDIPNALNRFFPKKRPEKVDTN